MAQSHPTLDHIITNIASNSSHPPLQTHQTASSDPTGPKPLTAADPAAAAESSTNPLNPPEPNPLSMGSPITPFSATSPGPPLPDTPTPTVAGTSRNIVILLDGTANKYGERNSNVLKLMSVLGSDEGSQIVYYSSGFGTILPDGTSTWGKMKQRIAKAADMGFAWSFRHLVCDAYRFLMDFSNKGDKIYVFGFSRGAYAARALAGMLERVGLLNPGNHNQVPLAYEVYTKSMYVRNEENADNDPTVLYRRIFARSRSVAVEFLGVWDTVSSLGIFAGRPHPFRFPFASASQSTKFFRQALALDERRGRFTPEFWREGPEMSRSKENYIDAVQDMVLRSVSSRDIHKRLQEVELELAEWAQETEFADGWGKEMSKQKECWFMGCHSDVGGGNTLNGESSLSNIPFRWLLREATRCGLLLGAQGICLQPALKLPIPPPPELATTIDNLLKLEGYLRLKEQSVVRSSQPDLAIDGLLREIKQEDLMRLVEVMAGLDTAVPVEVDAPGGNVDTHAHSRGEVGRESHGEGYELPMDTAQSKHESLTLAWKILSVVPMKPQRFRKKEIKAAVRDNLWRGRQIFPDQKIHRSVQIRLRHDTKYVDEKDKTRYTEPAAKVPMGRATWKDVGEGLVGDEGCWED